MHVRAKQVGVRIIACRSTSPAVGCSTEEEGEGGEGEAEGEDENRDFHIHL